MNLIGIYQEFTMNLLGIYQESTRNLLGIYQEFTPEIIALASASALISSYIYRIILGPPGAYQGAYSAPSSQPYRLGLCQDFLGFLDFSQDSTRLLRGNFGPRRSQEVLVSHRKSQYVIGSFASRFGSPNMRSNWGSYLLIKMLQKGKPSPKLRIQYE